MLQLMFNPGLMLTFFRTTQPRVINCQFITVSSVWRLNGLLNVLLLGTWLDTNSCQFFGQRTVFSSIVFRLTLTLWLWPDLQYILGLWVILVPTALLASSSRPGLGRKNEEHFVSCAPPGHAGWKSVLQCIPVSFLTPAGPRTYLNPWR